MSEIGDAIDEVREELADSADEFMIGTCSIIKNTFVNGGSAGDTMAPTATVTGVPYKCKSAGHRSQTVVGGKSQTISHWLTFPYNDDTLAIKPEDRIEDEDDSALVFQEPVVVRDSTSVFIKVAATLVHQGYQQ